MKRNGTAIRFVCGAAAAAALLVAATAPGVSRPGATMALITKVVRDVSMRNQAADWDAAEKGDVVRTGDRVRTGDQSLAILKFSDRSIVRVRERSEISVVTSDDGSGTVRSIESGGGSFGFDIEKQRQNERFRFTSPTSVASIRGTLGSWSSGAGGDTLILPEGLVSLLNRISDRSVDVPAGYIAFSNADGSLTLRPATEAELAAARRSASGGTPRELDLKLRNGEGEERDLRIRYRN